MISRARFVALLSFMFNSCRAFRAATVLARQPKPSMALTGRPGRSIRLQSTVADVLQSSIREMSDNNTPEPEDAALHLLAFALDLSYETGFRELRELLQFSLNPDLGERVLTSTERQTYRDLVARRLAHEPIQYILGQWDFLGYTLDIQAPLLCPRPETEELVLLVEDCAKELAQEASPLKILDVGAGTGCIGISLADRLRDSVRVVHAIDIQPIAVDVSQKNAARVLGSEIAAEKYEVQLGTAFDYEAPSGIDHYDIIVSNPPYIPHRDQYTMDPTVLWYESHDALFAGDDGMDVIRSILGNLAKWGRSGSVCWMEVDPSQPGLIRDECATRGLEFVASHRDLSGRDRFVQIQVS